MPYSVVRHGLHYAVINNDTGRVFSKSTSKEKAISQVRLLHAIHNGMEIKPVKKK